MTGAAAAAAALSTAAAAEATASGRRWSGGLSSSGGGGSTGLGGGDGAAWGYDSYGGPAFPSQFREVLIRRVGAATNARRVILRRRRSAFHTVRGNGGSNSDGSSWFSSESDGLAAAVASEVNAALACLLAPRFLPRSRLFRPPQDDDAGGGAHGGGSSGEEDDYGSEEEASAVVAARRAAASARNKLAAGVISRAEFDEVGRCLASSKGKQLKVVAPWRRGHCTMVI